MRKKYFCLQPSGIYVEEKLVQFTLIRSIKRKKTITLKIQDEEKITILAPLRTNEKILNDFIIKNEKWIKCKLKDLRESKKYASKSNLCEGDLLPYLGNHYFLKIAKINVKKNESCQIIDNTLELKFFSDSNSLNSLELVKVVLIRWYKDQAKKHIHHRLLFWCEKMKVKPNSWKISSALKRWGSCSGKNDISINWRLIFASQQLMDYIIVHELCHIIHKNHSSHFWNLVGSIMFDYKEAKIQLRKQEHGFLSLLVKEK